jgi:hypothetical protein
MQDNFHRHEELNSSNDELLDTWNIILTVVFRRHPAVAHDMLWSWQRLGTECKGIRTIANRSERTGADCKSEGGLG